MESKAESKLTSKNLPPEGFVPDWPCAPSVKSFITYRQGGNGIAPYASNNLALHVGDDIETVLKNRRQLMRQLGLSTPPVWLNQVHGNHIVAAAHFDTAPRADGCVSDGYGVACTVLTADCLPILFSDNEGTQVAAIHAGWRGLAVGAIATALARFNAPPAEIMAYLGPAIGQQHYEVGADVVEALTEEATLDYGGAMRPSDDPVRADAGHVMLDLYGIARVQLESLGVSAIYGGDRCTFAEDEHFYSYRRDGQTGRMASMIWLSR